MRFTINMLTRRQKTTQKCHLKGKKRAWNTEVRENGWRWRVLLVGGDTTDSPGGPVIVEFVVSVVWRDVH